MKSHFVRDYNRLVQHLVATEKNYDQAMAHAVGGHYAEIGVDERRVLVSLGLRDGDYVIDVGAGSGRLGTALAADFPRLRYLGTDVVPELLEFVRKKCGRPDWRFRAVETISIPENNGVADFVVLFSLFTHLHEAESLRYLQAARRVLKDSGTIVVSYLDRDIAQQSRMAGRWWLQLALRILGHGVLNKLLSKPVLERWAKQLNLSIDYTCDDVGQSVCTFRPSQASGGRRY